MSAPSPRTVFILLHRELRDAWRNRWFLLYASAFTVLALGLSWLSVSGLARAGHASLGRTAGSLVNLVLLIVPLMGLTLGAQALAGERERGSLLYLLAQPVDTLEVLLGKFLGIVTAVLAALLLGFAVAAMAISGQAGADDAWAFAGFALMGGLLAMASVAVGLCISAFSSRASVATGVALFAWLALVFAGDLGLMGTALVLRLDVGQLLAFTLLNPLQDFKLASILLLRGGMEALGPAGLYAARSFGSSLLPALVALLVAWSVIPLTLAAWGLRRRGGLA